MTRLLLSFTLLVFVSSCDKNKEKDKEENAKIFDRKEMVSQITTQYIIPAYEDYSTKTQNLLKAIEAFSQVPTIATLTESKNAWKDAVTAWQNVAFLEFGPAANIGLRSQTNIYPADTAKIHSNINSGDYNLELPANYSAKGFQSIDYLLHLPNKTDADILDYYFDKPQAADYLKAVCKELETNANSTTAEWATYSSDFINNTADNAQGSAVSTIVNTLSSHYETYVRKGKLGIPTGIFNGFSQTPMPGHSEAYYSDYSIKLLIAQMEAISAFINGRAFTDGTNGSGLDDYIIYSEATKDNEPLITAINNQINIIIDEARTLDRPLSKLVIEENAKAKALYQSMQKLVPLIKVDLTSALGVLITYQDNDGD